MINLLLRLLRGKGAGASPENRETLGRLAAMAGIATNLLLFCLKLAVGLVSGSIAITADAVNNLTDSASSLITLAGFRLARMPADEKHPYGHARFEYISGLAVSVLIMLIGIEFLQTSVDKIRSPTPVDFSAAVAVVLAASVLIKLWQGSFNKRMGQRIGSGALAATATDSRNDALSTLVVLLGAVIAHFTGWSLDGWMGALVAVFVLLSGCRLIMETLDPLLGLAPDRTLVAELEKLIHGYPSVLGIHDLMVHNYGPERCFASVHVELPACQDILVSHDIVDTIERDVAEQLGVSLVIHLDPIVTDDAHTDEARQKVIQAVTQVDQVLSIHDFRMVEGKTHTKLIFDVVSPPRYPLTDKELRQRIYRQVSVLCENCYCFITIDRSYTYTTQRIDD